MIPPATLAAALNHVLESLILIQTGLHSAISLMLLSAVGIWAVDGFKKAGNLMSRAAYDNISNGFVTGNLIRACLS